MQTCHDYSPLLMMSRLRKTKQAGRMKAKSNDLFADEHEGETFGSQASIIFKFNVRLFRSPQEHSWFLEEYNNHTMMWMVRQARSAKKGQVIA